LPTSRPRTPSRSSSRSTAEGEIVVTLQENNHIVVVSGTGEVLNHFSAGEVTLEGVDTEEEGALVFSDLTWPREPDAITWIDDTHFAMANEGDMDGGTRGWTIMSQDGEVIYESGTSFEHAIVEIGHYPEERSGNKGVEPESVTFGVFGGTPDGLRRRRTVVDRRGLRRHRPGEPGPAAASALGHRPRGLCRHRGAWPAGLRQRDRRCGPRAHVMVFEFQDAPAVYPHLTSAGMDELTGWGAISGQVMAEDGTIFAVSDSFYAMQPTIFHIDVSETPARIVDAIRVTREASPRS
jgi:hypothetical protein